MSKVLYEEYERECTHCHIVKPIDMFAECTKSKNGRKSYCRDCWKQMKINYRKTHPVEHKIRQMAENLIKRLTTKINDPRNKSYRDKGIQSKIGNTSAEVYKYLYENFYDDVKRFLDDREIPSIDRIDSNGHYEHGNIRIISAEENARMGREMSKQVCSKPVVATYEDGRIEAFPSIIAASRKTGVSREVLYPMLEGKYRDVGFTIRYKEAHQ